MIIKRKYQINQRYNMKKKDRLLQKQNDRCIHFKDFVRFHGEIQNRLKAMEEYFSLKDSEKTIKSFIEESYFNPPGKYYRPNKTDVYHNDDIYNLGKVDLKD